MSTSEFPCWDVAVENQVATVSAGEVGDALSSQWQFSEVLIRLRSDDGVRVVVVAGTEQGFPGRRLSPEQGKTFAADLTKPEHAWRVFSGIIRAHQAIAQMEKPVVAKVTSDAWGWGASVAFACDIIVAAEHVTFSDPHLMTANSVTPGDGGIPLMPLYMTPARAKEYLMTGRPYTASELDRLGIINYALPVDQVDAKVAELVETLLARRAYALAWTKRLANKLVNDQLNMSLDASAASEIIDLYQNAYFAGTPNQTLRD